ncbi:odorant receptor 30a-like [Halictus rubicundus]|uniref:odorant receptor 30a-like n=1 Tax=Halictus rubicundus TaxID=77578 RepID=UPI0040369E51
MNMSSRSSEHPDYKWAVSLNRYPLKLLGLWPPEDNREERLSDKLRAPVIFILMNVFLVFPSACMLLLKSNGFMMYLENTGYFIPCVISMMKFVTMYKNKTNLVPLLNMMANDWEHSKTDIERDTMIRCASVSRVFMKFCFAMFGPIFFTITILPKLGISYRMATNESAVFPLPTYYIVDVSHSPYFEIVYALQLIIVLATSFCYLGVDAFFGTIVLHITAQLEILQTRLTSIDSSDQFDHSLVDVVMDHIRLASAVDVMENTYMLLLLVLLLYFCAFNCVYIFEIVFALTGKGKSDSAGIYFYVGAYTNTLAQMALYCLAGQLLTTQSEGIYNAVYECNWTDLESNKARNLILIMVRAKKPFCLTAGKLFPINMLTLCNILKISFSYISFLLTKVV